MMRALRGGVVLAGEAPEDGFRRTRRSASLIGGGRLPACAGASYFGPSPLVRQSGGQPASHGRITRAGAGYARGMLAGAAWAASKAPGPLRAFCQRVRARRGMQVAAVATARKLTAGCWHLTIKGEDYAFALPSLVAHKQRSPACSSSTSR
jgi:transposase